MHHLFRPYLMEARYGCVHGIIAEWFKKRQQKTKRQSDQLYPLIAQFTCIKQHFNKSNCCVLKAFGLTNHDVLANQVAIYPCEP